MSKDDLIFNQFQNNKDIYSDMVGGTNPSMSQSTQLIPNQQNGSLENNSLSNYMWQHKYFPSSRVETYQLLRDFSLKQTETINTELITTTDGNLFIQDLQPNTVHVYSAEIFRYTQASTNFELNWGQSITVYLNGAIVCTSNNNAFSAKTIPVSLSSGWNKLDFYVYSSVPGQYFSTNNKLGDFANGWRTPCAINSEEVLNFSGTIDVGSNSKRDPLTNILRWDNGDPSNIYGYDLSRRGPYNSGLNNPIVLVESTGYYISGLQRGEVPDNGGFPNYYYTISAKNINGESLPSIEKNVNYEPFLTGALFVNAISQITLGANLTTGIYTYLVFGETTTVKTSPGTMINVGFINENNSMLVTWSGFPHPNITGYSIYRTSGIPESIVSGYPTDSNFSMTGYYVGGTSAGTFSILDTGRLSPLSTGLTVLTDYITNAGGDNLYRQFLNNATRLMWSGTSGVSDYYIYKTSYSGLYKKDSLIGITTGLSFIDSGYYFASGFPIQGKPTIFENIANIDYGTNKYKDTSVVFGQKYDYKIRTYNYDFNLGPDSDIQSFVAGDQIPPNTPSGISGVYFNGFSNIKWQNGLELDLVGTIIYQSGSNGRYNEIGRISQPTNFTNVFTAYSGIFDFKLANFDTSDNISPLSSSLFLTGTNTLEIGNVISTGIAATLTGYVKRSGDSMHGTLKLPTLSGINPFLDIAAQTQIDIHTTGYREYISMGYESLQMGAPSSVDLFVGVNTYINLQTNDIILNTLNRINLGVSGTSYLEIGTSGASKFYKNVISTNMSPAISGQYSVGSSINPYSGVYTNSLFAINISGVTSQYPSSGGPILTSPNGSRFRIIVDNAGALSTTAA